MKMSDAPLSSVEIETAPGVLASVIWLHGLGADGHDFEPIVPELRLPVPVRFVFPHAPVRPVTLNGGWPMRAWYDIIAIDQESRRDIQGMEGSRRALEALIRCENRRGVPSERIVLAGFSQGGAVALHTALRYPEKLAGLLALSTYLHTADTLEAEASEANQDIPIFMAHGVHDPVVPIHLGEESRDTLREHGYNVEWKTYPMPHAVNPEEIADIRRWLTEVLQKT